MGSRLSWLQIQEAEEYRGCWVALDNCTYDVRTAQPVEGTVVDADEDLVELCNRIRQNDGRRYAILFCGEVADTEPPSSRQPPILSAPAPRPSRPYVH
jgi:hypothetical protein